MAVLPQQVLSEVLSFFRLGVDPGRVLSMAALPIALSLGVSADELSSRASEEILKVSAFCIVVLILAPQLRGGLFSLQGRVDPHLRLVENREIAKELASTTNQLEEVGRRSFIHVIPQSNAVRPHYSATYSADSSVLNATNTYFNLRQAGQFPTNNYKTSRNLDGSRERGSQQLPSLQQSPVQYLMILKRAGVTHILVNLGTAEDEDIEALLLLAGRGFLTDPLVFDPPSMAMIFGLREAQLITTACGSSELGKSFTRGELFIHLDPKISKASLHLPSPEYWDFSQVPIVRMKPSPCFDMALIDQTANDGLESEIKPVQYSLENNLVYFTGSEESRNVVVKAVFRPAQLQIFLFRLTLLIWAFLSTVNVLAFGFRRTA
jgi:hypothetical protein